MPHKNIGNFVLTLAVIFSSTSALNATIYSATRSSYALGRDKMLPDFFAAIHKVRRTPHGALCCTGVIVLLVATALPTKDVASSASIMFLFLFFVVNLSVIKIRRNMADELTYGFMMPLFPLFPVLAIIFQVILAAGLGHMSKIAWIVAPVWVLLGGAIYLFYSKSRAITTADEILVLEERKHFDEKKEDRYRIMVAVANPASAAALGQNTYKLSTAKKGQVELLHMVPVPDQLTLRDAKKYIEPAKEALVEAMMYLSMHFPISTTIRYCRNIARGIVSAIRQKKIKMLVLGWHGAPTKTHLFSLGSTLDPIIERAPCNVVVFKDCGGNKTYKHVLVPVAGGPNSPLALEVADIMTEHDGTITVLTVDTGHTKFDPEMFLDLQAKRLGLDLDRFTVKIVKGHDPYKAILNESSIYDLVVIGTTHKPILLQMGQQQIPEKIALHCGKPTIMVKSNVGVRSWIKKWI